MSGLNQPEDQKKTADIARVLDAMWTKFLPDIRDRVSVLERATQAAAEGTLDGDLREAAKSAAHKLAGTLGTFGLSRGTDLARELELVFSSDRPEPLDPSQLKSAAAEIRVAVETRP